MSTQGGEVVFSFTGNASQLMTELKKIQTGTETTSAESVKSVKKIKGAFDEVEISTTKAAVSVGKVKSAFDQSNPKITQATTALGALGGVASRIDPQVGAVVSTIGTFGSVTGALTGAGVALTTVAAIAGPATVVIAGLAVAWNHYANELERAEKNQAGAAAVATRATDAAKMLADIEGVLDAATRKASGAQAEAKHTLDERTKAINAAIDAQELSTMSNQAAMDTADALEDKRDRLLAQAKAAYDAEIKASEASGIAKAAADALATSTKNLADANALLAAESAAATAGNTKYATVLDSIIAATDAATVAQLDDIAKVSAARDADIAKYKAQVAEAVQATAEGSSARETLESAASDYVVARNAQAARDIAEIEKGRARDSADIQKEITAVAKEEADKRVEYDRAVADATLSSWSSMTGDIASLYYQQADAQADAGSKGAKAAFRAGQAFAITQALVNGALAVTNVMATIPAPAWPVAIPAAVLATGVQIATIAAQKPPTVKHYGGAIYPDEAMMKTRSGEAVLTPQATQAMGGAAGVAQYNRDAASGMQGGGGFTLRIGRLAFREGLRGDIRAGGVIEQAIDKRFSRTGIAPGQSGKLAVA